MGMPTLPVPRKYPLLGPAGRAEPRDNRLHFGRTQSP